MTKAQHTPGPWKIDYGYDRIINSIGPCHPDRYASSSWLRVTEADAILIAAAPDLLDALIKVVSVYDGNHVGPIVGMSFDKARAAIAKATAQQ